MFQTEITWYVYTNEGWKDSDQVFTPELKKVKKNAAYEPIQVNEALTEELRNSLPMVITRKGYYFIAAL